MIYLKIYYAVLPKYVCKVETYAELIPFDHQLGPWEVCVVESVSAVNLLSPCVLLFSYHSLIISTLVRWVCSPQTITVLRVGGQDAPLVTSHRCLSPVLSCLSHELQVWVSVWPRAALSYTCRAKRHQQTGWSTRCSHPARTNVGIVPFWKLPIYSQFLMLQFYYTVVKLWLSEGTKTKFKVRKRPCFGFVAANMAESWLTLLFSQTTELNRRGGANFEWCVYKQRPTNPVERTFKFDLWLSTKKNLCQYKSLYPAVCFKTSFTKQMWKPTCKNILFKNRSYESSNICSSQCACVFWVWW